MSNHTLDSKIDRRTVFVGAGSAGALAGIAVLMPQLAPPRAVVSSQPIHHTAESPGAYRVTDHVLRYYRSAGV